MSSKFSSLWPREIIVTGAKDVFKNMNTARSRDSAGYLALLLFLSHAGCFLPVNHGGDARSWRGQRGGGGGPVA